MKKNRPQKEGEGGISLEGVAAYCLTGMVPDSPTILDHLHVPLDMQKTNFLQGESGSPGYPSQPGDRYRDVSGGSSYTA